MAEVTEWMSNAPIPEAVGPRGSIKVQIQTVDGPRNISLEQFKALLEADVAVEDLPPVDGDDNP